MPNHFPLRKVPKKELDLEIIKVSEGKQKQQIIKFTTFFFKDWKKKKDKNEVNKVFWKIVSTQWK